MKNLARHIELLLRNNDCVILPGFGGFIAHDVPAYYVAEEGLYYPPSRSISFNAAITMNDGLLAQSYMKNYQVDYARAIYMIDVAIEQLTDTLDEEGSVTLPHIGTITQDIHQTLQFTPDAAGIASPKYFGLSSFTIKDLNQLHKSTESDRKDKVVQTHKAKTINIHINKDMLHRVLSTAAVFLLLLMIALPVGHHQPTDVASLRLSDLIITPQIVTPEAEVPAAAVEPIAEEKDTVLSVVPQPIAIEKAAIETKSISSTTETATVDAPTIEVNQPIVTTTQSTKTYHIIVASLPNHRGADEALSQYTSQGYTHASLVERDNRVRISLAQFADKDEANEYLYTLRQNEKFQNAWLLAVRN